MDDSDIEIIQIDEQSDAKPGIWSLFEKFYFQSETMWFEFFKFSFFQPVTQCGVYLAVNLLQLKLGKWLVRKCVLFWKVSFSKALLKS